MNFSNSSSSLFELDLSWLHAGNYILLMGKKYFFLFFIIFLFVAITSSTLPKEETCYKFLLVKGNNNRIIRALTASSNIDHWWPGKDDTRSITEKKSPVKNYNNLAFKIPAEYHNGIEITIFNEEISTLLTLKIAAVNRDSSIISYHFSLPLTYNPIKKIRNSYRAKLVENNITLVLNRLLAYSAITENIYGVHISQERVKDKYLVTTKITAPQYPSVSTIYTQIAVLEQHIAANDAKATNFPMLHTIETDKEQVEVFVAIPIDRQIRGNNSIICREMMAGNILTASSKGGIYSVHKDFRQVENYMADHLKSAPAMPFEVLVTNRSLEKDTSKWVTKIHYPVY